MAQKVLVELIDDLDGGPADETVRFGLGSQMYEIDLSEKNAYRLRGTVAPYVRRGRKAQAARRTQVRPVARRRQTAAIRAWAKEQGHMNGDRGRIPAWIMDEYDRVHGT